MARVVPPSGPPSPDDCVGRRKVIDVSALRGVRSRRQPGGGRGQAFDRIARGERPVPEGIDYGDPNPWNAGFVEKKGDTSFENMVRELKATEAAFVGAAGKVPTDRFEEGRAAYRILHATGINHYREHAPEIRHWRERVGI